MRAIITSLTVSCCFATSAQNIVLNPTFGNDGFTYADNASEIKKMVLTPTGDIISAGSKTFVGGYGVALTKHDPIGNQDLTFGSNGVTHTNIAVYDDVYDLKLQADGKILLAGSTYTGSDTGPGGSPIIHAFVIRYLPNGIIDSSFATNGIYKVTDYNQSEFSAVIVQNDQSLRLVSFSDGITYITKLTSAGTLDTSFGTNGSQAISNLNTFFFFSRGAISLTDGSILIYGLDDTGFLNPKVACVKTDVSGNLITSFGQNGVASFDLDINPNIMETLTKAQEQTNGKMVLTGESTSKLIIRIEADGTLDSTFALNGVLFHTFPSNDMVIQPDGKILIGGNQPLTFQDGSLLVTRFHADGTIDNSFNGTGNFEFDFSNGLETLRCMVLTPPDRLLIGGSTNFVSGFMHFLLAEIDMSNTLNLPGNSVGNVSIYPNPTSDILTISTVDESITTIQLTDAAGRLISTHPAQKMTNLSLANLPAGMYQVIFTTNSKERISKKLIKN